MSVNFSPAYGQNPNGTQQALQTDASGNLLVNAAVLNPAQSIAINDNTVRTQHWHIDAAGNGQVYMAAGTAVITSVNSAASSTSLLAANAIRKQAVFYNDSTAILYLAFAGSASTTAYTVQIPSQGYFEMPLPIYTGAVFGIWSAANGAVRITELS